MAPILIHDDELEDAFDESLLDHARRLEQLQRLGLPRFLAEKFADLVDLRDLEQLIEHGCMSQLPLEIVRPRLLAEQNSEISTLAQGSADIVRRLGEQPIIEAGAVPGYGPIFNAGAVYHDGRFHVFARGVRNGYQSNPGPGARFLDYISDVLVFVSDDGRSYEFQQVLAESSPDGVWCYEDPRVQVVRSRGEDQWVMSYTNLPAPETKKVWRIGMHKLD